MAARQVSVQFLAKRGRPMTLTQPGCRLRIVLFILVSLIPFRFVPAQNAPRAPRVVQAINERQVVTLKGNVHPLARAEFDQGAVADSQPMNRILLLLQRSPEQEASLQQLLENQQSKSNPNFHQWLTPEQFGVHFGVPDSDLLAVTQWLTSQGFTDVNVGAGRSVIEFSGTAAQVRNSFHTEIHRFHVGAEDHVANVGDPQIPAALAPVIAGVVSLHNFSRKSHTRYLGAARRERNGSKVQPLFTFPNPYTGNNLYGVGPGDFAVIYNSKPLIAATTDGTGQTIAIVGETQINPQDVIDFRTMFGLPNNFSASNIVLNGMDPGFTSQDEESESDLDVQWSGAAAPGAAVKFVVSASTPASAGIDLSALYIVEHNLADVMSVSYGACESDLGSAGNAFYNQLWEQAAAQGISVMVSSGDGGSAGCDDFNAQPAATRGIAVSGLAGTAFNVSVGGTDFNQINVWTNYWSPTNDSVTGASATGYIPETPWNENCAQLGLTGCGTTAPQGSVNIVAGSGGPSTIYGKPKWQMGVSGVPNDNHRDQPDISLFASPGFTGSAYIFCQSDLTGVPCNLNSYGYTFHLIGGTSASAPAFAGVMALVNQYQAAHGGSSRQGNPNYVLYALAKKSGASCASSSPQGTNCIFNDIVKGNDFLKTRYGNSVGTNSVACQGGTPNCNSNSPTVDGVLVDPSHTSTEAWTAAAGYDMATGLGSLNVNNLATNWASASTIPTTTTLTLSPTTGITHGPNENVTVGVTVKPNTGSGVPAGDVSLIANLSSGDTQGLDQFTLSNGAVSGSSKTQSLPGGTYTVYAHYAGDGTNAPSDSAPVQVTVGKEPSQTFIVVPSFDSSGNLLNGNATSVTYGSRYIIRMYATNSSASASMTGAPSPTCEQVNELTCPSGSVTLTANGAPVDGGTFALNNNGYTRDLVPTLTGGTYSLLAQYSGDNSYSSSTSAAGTFTVTPAPVSLYLYSGSSPLVGTPFYFDVTGYPQAPGGVKPTGTVSVFDGTTLIAGPIPVNGAPGINGSSPQFDASTQLTLNSGGDHTLTAKYSGDSDYSTVTSSPLVIHPLFPTSITITPSSTSINYGQSVTITATVTSSGKSPAMTGPFYFYGSYTQIPGPVTGTLTTDSSGNQVLTATVTTVPQSTEYVQVNFSGDSNFASAYNTSTSINVNIPDFILGPASGLNVVPVAGQTASGQITITPASQTPSTVSLALQYTPAIPGYAISLSPLQVSLNGSSATATLSLTSTVTVPAAATRTSRHAEFFIFRLPPRNWWSLSAVFGLAALGLLAFPGRHNRYRAALGLGLACLVCLVIGCGGGSSGGGPPLPPPPGPTTITLSTSNAKVDQNGQFTLTAKVTGSGALTGTVAFFDNGHQIFAGNIPLTNGQVQATNYGYVYGMGVHQFAASYSGDLNDLPSTSGVLTQVVTGTTTVNIQANTGGDFHYLQATIGIQ